MKAEILSYSRARGLFAGVSLVGSAIDEDKDANRAFYGRPLGPMQIVNESPRAVGTAGSASIPDVVTTWRNTLRKHSK